MARILLAFALSAGCRIATFASESEPMTLQVKVELDIFSGMPNPEWMLTDDEAANFVTRLEALQEPTNARLSNHLGYRGFVVTIRRGDEIRTIAVQKGAIHSSSAGASKAVKDAGRALERWLIKTGAPYISAEVLKVVQDDLLR